VPTHYFRVDGADQETGEETYLVLQAESKPQAEKIARKQGLLISSVRIAKPGDWQATAPTTVADEDPPPPAIEEPMPREAELPLSFVDSTVVSAPATPDDVPDAVLPARPSSRRSGAAVVLGCVGGALVLGGVLALALALWPDAAARNELQQLDFRLNQLTQTIIGTLLVLGGLVVFVLAGVLSLMARFPQ
jgi:hypothetical protein